MASQRDLSQLYADALAPFQREADRLLPRDAEILDAHTHLGLDEDGRSLDVQGLLSMLDAAGARRACVFALHDPERKPSYRVPNDRVLRWAGETDGRLVPFCRLDPAEDPVKEGERCLSAGAKGIKLHPRAQAFDFESQEIDGIFALAEEAAVPILIHAGRGLPPLADGLVKLALRHPGAALILAHGAICDQGIIASRLADHPRALYDISCFFPIDVIQLLARVPAERVVFASDPPYGMTSSALYLALRVAAQAGLEEQALRELLGETMTALLEGAELRAPKAPRRSDELVLSGRLARVYGYASLAGPALFAGVKHQAMAMLEMALAACRDPEPGGQAEALLTIESALQAAVILLGAADRHPQAASGAIDLLYRSIAHAATAIPDGVAGEKQHAELPRIEAA